MPASPAHASGQSFQNQTFLMRQRYSEAFSKNQRHNRSNCRPRTSGRGSSCLMRSENSTSGTISTPGRSLRVGGSAKPAAARPSPPRVRPPLRDTARAMSQENVEIVRAFFEAWNAGDMDAVRDACDPKIILWGPEGWPEPGPFFGQEAVMQAFEQLRETFDSDWQELKSDLVHIGDRVAV